MGVDVWWLKNIHAALCIQEMNEAWSFVNLCVILRDVGMILVCFYLFVGTTLLLVSFTIFFSLWFDFDMKDKET
ncbi:hypothetical protein GYH30_057151 [Glycine max]|nr:hypothetical protein GYH30_057151 [Glycine max]